MLAVPSFAQSVPEVVRVRVLGLPAPTDVRVEPLAGPVLLFLDGVESGAIAPGTSATVTRRGPEVRVQFGGADVSARTVRMSGDGVRLRAGSVDRRYPGDLSVRVDDGALELVTHAPLEPYVASVVQAEFGFPVLEGAKAQAVLARTYAARRVGQHPTYDLHDDQRSQVYRGEGHVSETSVRAALETRGEVLAYGRELADAYYFSSSGGHTADNDAVWRGAPVPYLRGVPDPFDQAAPDHTWRTSASRSAVLRALSRRAGGTVTGVEIERTSRSGRVLTVRLLGTGETMPGTTFRQVVNAAAGPRTVRSTRFAVASEGDRYVFWGGGFGHGVGMSQYGALGQARAGRTYRDILAHYFAGTEVRIAGGAIVQPALAVATPASTPRGTTQEAIPREPASALRTRYQPPTARRWPTPRRIAREPTGPTGDRETEPVGDGSAPLPPPPAVSPRDDRTGDRRADDQRTGGRRATDQPTDATRADHAQTTDRRTAPTPRRSAW